MVGGPEENERAWKILEGLIQRDEQGRVVGCNLDIKNPHAGDAEDHRKPAEIVEAIIERERTILTLLGEIKAELAEVQE